MIDGPEAAALAGGSHEIVIRTGISAIHVPPGVSADHFISLSGRGEADGMIIPPGPLKVMVATKPVDFRKGAIGFAALVEHELGLKPFCGVAYIFRSRRANRIKLRVWDGTGLVLVSKVLQTGNFHRPGAGDGVMRLSAAQASALFEGSQWSRMHDPRGPRPVTTR